VAVERVAMAMAAMAVVPGALVETVLVALVATAELVLLVLDRSRPSRLLMRRLGSRSRRCQMRECGLLGWGWGLWGLYLRNFKWRWERWER